MKKCPYCAEEIQDEAVKCRYCNEWLDASKRPTPPALPPALPTTPPRVSDETLPWFCRTSYIILTFAMVPPLAIPLIWLRPKLHWGWKAGLSAAILLVCWAMVAAFQAIFEKYTEMIDMMNGMGF